MSAFLSVLPKLGELFQAALTMVELRRGKAISVEEVTIHVLTLAKDWNPKVNGKLLLADVDTRRAGARFLAGVAIALKEG